MRARILIPGGMLLATVEIDESKLPRRLGASDRVVLVIDDPQARPEDRNVLMLDGRLESVR